MVEYKTLFSQQNKEWADVLIGNSKELTIGNYGCLLTCMAMTCTAFGYEETPLTLNNKLVGVGGFSSDEGDEALVIPAAMPTLFPAIHLQDVRFYPKTEAPLSELIDWVTDGESVIIQIDRSPSAGLQSHYLILTDTRDYYRCIDPWDGKVINLMDRYSDVTTSTAVLITAHVVFHHNGSVSLPASIIGKRRIIAEQLNVREGPGTEYDAVSYLNYEDEVDIVATRGNWAQLSDGNWICERLQFTEIIES